MANETKGMSFDELKAAFETTDEKIEKRMGILDKIRMPTPEEKPLPIRLLWSKDDSGQPVAVVEKYNSAFRGGKALFMTAEYYEQPGERQLGLSKSLFIALAAAAKEKGLAFEELIGKVGDISASYYTSAPISLRKDPGTGKGKPCMKCQGQGCTFCTVTGNGQGSGIATGLQPPTVFSFRLRDDLMNSVGSGGSIATQF